MSRYAHSIRAIFGCILDGICDSLRLPSTLIFFLSSVTVRVRTAHCIVLNGFIFLGSILIADWMMVPIIRTILAIGGIAQHGSTEDTINMPLASASIPLPSGEDQSIGEWINVIFLYAYQLLWIYPLYAISFILNAIWYQDIADASFYITHSDSSQTKSITFQKWVATMSDEVYRLLLVTAYMLQMTLVSFLPFGIGNILVLCHLCWMYSLYSFEYKWSLLGWSLEYRLKYFERHWAYFLGFGLPAVCLSLIFPKFISLGIFAFTFPIFIILAIIARPTMHTKKEGKKSLTTGDLKNQPHTDKKSNEPSSSSSSTANAAVLLPQLPIFRVATWINWWLLSQLQRRSKATAARRPSIDKPNTTATAAAATSTHQHDQ